MYVRTMDRLIDGEKEPVVLLFDNITEVRWLRDLLSGMVEASPENEMRVRAFAEFPDTDEDRATVAKFFMLGEDEITIKFSHKISTHETEQS